MNWIKDKIQRWLRIEYHTGEISNLHCKIRAYSDRLSKLEAANNPIHADANIVRCPMCLDETDALCKKCGLVVKNTHR